METLVILISHISAKGAVHVQIEFIIICLADFIESQKLVVNFDGLTTDEEIGMWAWGDVKGFVLEKKVSFTKVYDDNDREDEDDFEWEEVDSCWGYFMETEDLINEVISEHDLQDAA